MAQADYALRDRLEGIADRYQCGLQAAYLPKAADGRNRQDIEVYYHEVVQVAQEAASTGEPTARSYGFIFVQPYSSPPKVVLAPFADTTGRPFLGDQIAAGIKQP